MEDKRECDGQSIITPSVLLSSLDRFLSISTNTDYRHYDGNGRSSDGDQRGISTALFLLQNLPPARPAVLSYLAQVLSKQVWNYMNNYSNSSSTSREDSVEVQMESLLGELIEKFPSIWGDMIARWAVERLGIWGEDWHNSVVARNDATLEERVAAWLACKPVNTLANLTVLCVANDPDNTIQALLEASINSGPVLDWLIAHVGCSFPATIVNRVLSLGLKNFTSSNQGEANIGLYSVNIILNHLAERHFTEIQKGLYTLLLSSFSDDDKDHLSQAIVPYLLHLANTNQSASVLNALTSTLPQLLQPSSHITKLANQLSKWIPKYFSSTADLLNLLVNLMTETEGPATCELLHLLLKGSVPLISGSGNSFASQLLHLLIEKLCTLSYKRRHSSQTKPRVPLLVGLGNTNGDNRMDSSCSHANDLAVVEALDWQLLKNSDVATRRLGQLLTLLIAQQGPEAMSSLLLHLMKSRCSQHHNCLYLLNCVVNSMVKQQSLIGNPIKTLTHVLSNCLVNIDDFSEVVISIEQIEALVIGCKYHKSFVKNCLMDALLYNLPHLSKLICIPQLQNQIMELIGFLPIEKSLSLKHLLSLSHSIVFCFFKALENGNRKNKLQIANQCDRILAKLFSSPQSTLSHSLLVRLLFESSYRQEVAYLFGAQSHLELRAREAPDHLLHTNYQFNSWVKLPKSHNAIFHSGIVAKSGISERSTMAKKISTEEVTLNTQLLLNLLGACCRMHGSMQGITTIALLLVEYVSPDIMYNGFPWPEENVKFTFERDLAIKKTFQDFPIAWNYLEMVARCRPSLCYCSVLVRALTAAYTTFWNTCPMTYATEAVESFMATKRLLEIMVVGQFMPAEFAVLPQMVQHLSPHEVAFVLQDVWAYLRDNTPSPDRWIELPSGVYDRPVEPLDPSYTDRFRKLIQVHIESLGHLLPTMPNFH